MNKIISIIQRFIFGVKVRRSYPNWKKIFKSDIKRFNERVFKADKKSTLFIPTLGIQSSVVIINGLLALLCRLRGNDVSILQCDGVLPICQVAVIDNYNEEMGLKKSICAKCFKRANKSFRSTNCKTLLYSEFLIEEDYKLASELAQSIEVNEITDFHYANVNLGEHVRSGALKFFGRGDLPAPEVAEPILRRYLQTAILTQLVIKRAIKQQKVDVAVFHHGIYVPEGVIGETCREAGVRVVNWNPAYRKGSFLFSHEHTYHHTLMSEDVSVWENIEWNETLNLRIDDYLNSRLHGGKDWISFVSDKPEFDMAKFRQAHPSHDVKKPTIGLLTNVIWDAQLHYPNNIFNSMMEWMEATVMYFRDRPDLQLLIRIHPAEILGQIPSKQRVWDELSQRFNLSELDNVFIVDSTSTLSTYSLMEICNGVLIYGTKTGIELVARGIPVIVAGEAWIKNKGLTIDPVSQEHYFEILDELPFSQRLADDQILKGLRYAHHFFMRRMIPINKVKLTGSVPAFTHDLTSIADLLAGQDPGLDTIYEGIVNGEPFVYKDEDHFVLDEVD